MIRAVVYVWLVALAFAAGDYHGRWTLDRELAPRIEEAARQLHEMNEDLRDLTFEKACGPQATACIYWPPLPTPTP